MGKKYHSNGALNLTCNHLRKEFGSLVALKDIDIDITSSSLGLLGPNGSGKTTFIKLLLGLIHPTSGIIEVNIDLQDFRVVPDQPVLPNELTVDEWISYIEQLHGPNTEGLDVQSIFQLNGNWKLKNLSAGQIRKAALIPIFYGEPELIILDEPTNFLDIVAREQILQLLKSYLSKKKANLIIATHRLNEMRIFANDVLILREGQLIKKIELKNDLPRSYSVVVDQDKDFAKLLRDHNEEYILEEDFSGVLFRIYPSEEIWNIMEKYRQSGGNILKFESNDILKHTIEELLV